MVVTRGSARKAPPGVDGSESDASSAMPARRVTRSSARNAADSDTSSLAPNRPSSRGSLRNAPAGAVVADSAPAGKSTRASARVLARKKPAAGSLHSEALTTGAKNAVTKKSAVKPLVEEKPDNAVDDDAPPTKRVTRASARKSAAKPPRALPPRTSVRRASHRRPLEGAASVSSPEAKNVETENKVSDSIDSSRPATREQTKTSRNVAAPAATEIHSKPATRASSRKPPVSSRTTRSTVPASAKADPVAPAVPSTKIPSDPPKRGRTIRRRLFDEDKSAVSQAEPSKEDLNTINVEDEAAETPSKGDEVPAAAAAVPNNEVAEQQPKASASVSDLKMAKEVEQEHATGVITNNQDSEEHVAANDLENAADSSAKTSNEQGDTVQSALRNNAKVLGDALKSGGSASKENGDKGDDVLFSFRADPVEVISLDEDESEDTAAPFVGYVPFADEAEEAQKKVNDPSSNAVPIVILSDDEEPTFQETSDVLGNKAALANEHDAKSSLQVAEKKNSVADSSEKVSAVTSDDVAGAKCSDSPSLKKSGGSEREVIPVVDTSGVQMKDFLATIASKPDVLLKRCPSTTGKLRSLVRELYEQQSAAAFGPEALKLQFAPKSKSKALSFLGPLVQLETGDDFDSEQLWEELKMRNEPFCRHMERVVKEQQESFHNDVMEVEEQSDKEDIAVQKPSLVSILKTNEIAEKESSDEQEGSDVEDLDRRPSKVRFADDEAVEDVNMNINEEQSESESRGAAREESGEANPKNRAASLEDGFFNIADMEAFADEAEALALDGRLVASDESDNGDEGMMGDAEETDDLLFGEGASKSDEGTNLRYKEFFAPPGSDKVSEDTARALRRATLFDDGSGDDGSEESDDEAKTPLERSRAALRETVDAMEDAAVSKKPWQLRGEVLGDTRPKNSVLDTNFDHDIAFHNRAFSAPQAAEDIEDLIRQRIHDKLFDDVVCALPPDYEEAKNSKKDIPEISQEKPTEGLGELYAREFAEQREQISKNAEAAGVVRKEEDPEETPQQAEVNRLFKRLCTKLDAMASLNFTPSMPKIPDEMTVKPNVPALAAEEAIPEAVSDAALLAPSEVHNAKKKEALGDMEKTKKDRRRNRRRVKKRLSSLNKERTKVARHEEQGNPLLAEKRRAERALERRGKKPRTEKSGKSNKTGEFSKSNRFFSNLENSMAADAGAKKVKDVDPPKSSSASRYKL